MYILVTYDVATATPSGAKRRTHDKAAMPTLAKCANCGAWHIYHTVCGECGYYRGKLAIEQQA